MVLSRWRSKKGVTDPIERETSNHSNYEEHQLERARLNREIPQAVENAKASLPPEKRVPGARIPLQPIRFDLMDCDRGEIALYTIGDFMHTNKEETVYFVRPRTRKLLDAVGIPYELVPPGTTKLAF